MSRDGFNGAALKLVRSGDGGNSDEPPHNERMESRISKLEDFAFDANGRLARIETKLDHVDKEVSQVKWWIVAQIAALFLAVIGTGIAIQQMTVSTFQAAAAQPQATQAAQQPIIINVPAAAASPVQPATKP